MDVKSLNISFLLILIAVAGFFVPKSVQAQGVVSPVFMTDFEAAQTAAERQELPLLLIFSGSDWCRGCIALDQAVFQQEAFIRFAEEKLVVVRADFPQKKKNRLPEAETAQNEALAEKFNPKGQFPQVVLLSPQGELMGVIPAPADGSPETFIAAVRQLSNAE